MIEWLTQRPSTLLSSWLIHMMHGLRKSGRFSVLIEITHGTLEKVCTVGYEWKNSAINNHTSSQKAVGLSA